MYTQASHATISNTCPRYATFDILVRGDICLLQWMLIYMFNENMWCLLSMWLYPYVVLSNIALCVGADWFPSPFPLAVAASTFTILYYPLILKMDCFESVVNIAIHFTAVFLSKFDVSIYCIMCNLGVVCLYTLCTFAVGTDPISIYFRYLPELHAKHPGLFNCKKWRCMCRSCDGVQF